MEMMKNFLAAILICLPLAVPARDPEGMLTYSLPRTVIRLTVTAEKEVFHAGPYARYAAKYLGNEARGESSVRWTVRQVDAVCLTEADPQARYSLSSAGASASLMSLSAQGLVAVEGGSPAAAAWSFPASKDADFHARGVTTNLREASTTLYGGLLKDDGGIAEIQQQITVSKSLEDRARDAAAMIVNLRNKRIQILTGDTDAAYYSGEALGAAVQGLEKLENEYLSMFYGYPDVTVQHMTFDVIPSESSKSQTYVAFRVSDTEGLVAASELSGKPYLLELSPEPLSEPQAQDRARKAPEVFYRIPAACDVRLTDGVSTLFRSRFLVYQLGVQSSLPIVTK